jgi:septum formation protein
VELLKELVGEFRVVASDAFELRHDQLTARELARANAFRKAQSVAKGYPDAVILGADTLVSLEGELFGKPGDLDEARQMLERLQGAAHDVVTAVCLLQRRSRRQVLFAEMTEVRFKPLTTGQIDQYLTSINPLDKAGAYAIQEGGDKIVAEFSGSYSNVVGLPLERLRVELEAWGFQTKGASS